MFLFKDKSFAFWVVRRWSFFFFFFFFFFLLLLLSSSLVVGCVVLWVLH